MIRSLFLPDKLGARYLFTKKIVGVTINYNAVHAAVVTMHNTNITVHQLLQEPLVQNQELSHEQRVTAALEAVIRKVGTYDELRTTLTNAPIIFKELTFPFNDKEKIDLVVRYEVEPFLPFALNDAAVDTIVTHSDATGTTVQVAAVQKKYINEHLALFAAAHLEPDAITVDLFNLYGLYRMIPNYYATGVVTIIDMGTQTTKLLYCVDGTLKKIRTLDQGVGTIAKQLGSALEMTPAQAAQEMMRFGMLNTQNPDYTSKLEKLVAGFGASIRFTLDSCAAQLKNSHEMTQHCLLTGIGAEIPELEASLARATDIRCTHFEIDALRTTGVMTVDAAATISASELPVIANAIPSEISGACNLRTDASTQQQNRLLLYQIIVAGILFVTIITALMAHTFIQQRKLEYAKHSLTNEVLTYLRDRNLAENERNIKDAIGSATEKVQHDEDIWFAFSSQTRFSFLKYLQSLSTALDRAGLQLQLERLDMTENTISLKGEVPSYEKLTLLEQELNKSGLFVSVPPLQELKFDKQLTLKKLNGTP